MNSTFTTRELTKAGFVHTPELDFADDGTRFKMFSYRGMPVSYAKANGEFYVAIRPDYLESGYNYHDLSDGAKNAMDEFNGGETVDVWKLIQNINLVAPEVGLA